MQSKQFRPWMFFYFHLIFKKTIHFSGLGLNFNPWLAILPYRLTVFLWSQMLQEYFAKTGFRVLKKEIYVKFHLILGKSKTDPLSGEHPGLKRLWLESLKSRTSKLLTDNIQITRKQLPFIGFIYLPRRNHKWNWKLPKTIRRTDHDVTCLVNVRPKSNYPKTI